MISTVARAGSLCGRIWSISDGSDESQVGRDAGMAGGLAAQRSLPLVPGGPAKITFQASPVAESLALFQDLECPAPAMSTLAPSCGSP